MFLKSARSQNKTHIDDKFWLKTHTQTIHNARSSMKNARERKTVQNARLFRTSAGTQIADTARIGFCVGLSIENVLKSTDLYYIVNWKHMEILKSIGFAFWKVYKIFCFSKSKTRATDTKRAGFSKECTQPQQTSVFFEKAHVSETKRMGFSKKRTRDLASNPRWNGFDQKRTQPIHNVHFEKQNTHE